MKHHPERSEGSLGTGVPREDMDGLSPRGVSQGVSLGTPSRPGDAIPNKVRDASLSPGKTKMGAWQDKKRGLGRIKNGRSTGQSRVDLFKESQRDLGLLPKKPTISFSADWGAPSLRSG